MVFVFFWFIKDLPYYRTTVNSLLGTFLKFPKGRVLKNVKTLPYNQILKNAPWSALDFNQKPGFLYVKDLPYNRILKKMFLQALLILTKNQVF